MELLSLAMCRWGLLPADGGDMEVSSLPGDVDREGLPEAHRAIYTAVPEARVVLRVDTQVVKQVARSWGGLRCLAQGGAYFHGTVASCRSLEEATQQLQKIPRAVALRVQDGGGCFYVFGKTPGAVFTLAFYLDKTCRRQLLVSSHPVVEPDVKVWEHARQQLLDIEEFAPGCEWPAVRSWLQGETAQEPQAWQQAENPGSEEQTLRRELSDAHKELHWRGFDELIWNHCSARFGDGWLITSGDQLWNLMEPESLKRGSENCTADILHSAVYAALPTATAVVHTHSPAIEAASCLKAGVVEPPGSEFVGRLAYYDWEGVSDDKDECQRVSAAIRRVPGCVAVIMRNHGAITFGCSVREALNRHVALDAACRETLLRAQEFASEEHRFDLEELQREPFSRDHRCLATVAA